MDKFLIVRVLHFIYLALGLGFIYFYFTAYQPVKLHNICAERSAKIVLKSAFNTDAYYLYHKLYKSCTIKENISLLALFKAN